MNYKILKLSNLDTFKINLIRRKFKEKINYDKKLFLINKASFKIKKFKKL